MSAWRFGLVLVLFGTAVAAMCGRVVYLAVTEKEFLQQQGDARSVRSVPIPAMRGVIYDREGEALAVSTPVFAVWTDPSKADFSVQQAKDLARVLELDLQDVQALSKNADREFVYLKRRVEYATAQQVEALGLDHIYLRPEYRRYYPAGETTAHVVGVTDIDDRGIEGSEKTFNQSLQGLAGSKVVLKDRKGQTIRDLEFRGIPSFGQDLSLSIDLRLQFIAYRELKSAVASHQAQSGSLIMADARTGEVLALVNQPSYNPNEKRQHLAGMRNRAITDTYEPGSTVKPFTAIAALESGRYRADSTIDTSPGYFSVSNKLIQDPINRGEISLGQAIQKSSQVAIAKVALDLRERAIYDVLARAGIGNYVSLGLPGETTGYLDDAQLRYPVVRTSLSFGYGVSVTPLQLTQAYLSLASGGYHLPLQIMKQSGQPQRTRVFDERIVRDVVKMMELVTHKEGTAPGAAVNGYRVAGKTGTARIVGPEGYDDERHVAWFAGLAPVEEPRIVMVVLVNEPTSGLSGGGAVAAPIFSRVAQRSLRLLGVPGDGEMMAALESAGGTG
ncbi:MAG: penicillin-binding transpeptidase domain-containing protein [Pseudomonadota bacterium]